jgi:hypothetical protein
MSQAKLKPEPELRCWDCGAVNDRGSSECWLCQRRDWGVFRMSGEMRDPAPMPAPSRPITSIATLMIVIALTAVVFGVFRDAPGLAIAFLFFALLAWGMTELKASRRRRRGAPMSGLEKAIWIAGLLILMPVLLMAALVAALFVICSSGGAGGPVGMVFVAAAAIATIIFISVIIVRS